MPEETEFYSCSARNLPLEQKLEQIYFAPFLNLFAQMKFLGQIHMICSRNLSEQIGGKLSVRLFLSHDKKNMSPTSMFYCCVATIQVPIVLISFTFVTFFRKIYFNKKNNIDNGNNNIELMATTALLRPTEEYTPTLSSLVPAVTYFDLDSINQDIWITPSTQVTTPNITNAMTIKDAFFKQAGS
jgi:hypothetical protein